MKKFFKWFGIILGSIILIITVILLFMYSSVNSRLEKTYSIKISKIEVPSDSVSLERGKHRALLCQGCHGEDFSGKVIFSSSAIGDIIAPNITSGLGGVGKSYTNEDFVRLLIHGVKKNSKAVFVMPCEDFTNFSRTDLLSLIAYMKTLAPIDNKMKNYNVTFFGKILVAINAFGNIIHAETIDHSKTYKEDVATSASPEFGKYLVNISGCKTCHGKGLNGGKDPNPDAPPGPNLTPGGNLGKWSENDFISVLRTGKTPEGKILNPVFMPWTEFSKMTDLEISAVYKYLRTLEGKATAGI